MTRRPTILGHLVGWGLPRRFEDAATEGLVYLSRRYRDAHEAFVAMLREVCPGLPADLTFQSQVACEEGRPDIVGSSAGVLRVIVENKFWAGLTDNQPTGYLRTLARTPEPTALLFIAPRQRGPSLWAELVTRSQVGKVDGPESAHSSPHVGTATVGSTRLALTTWTHVLALMRGSLSGNDDALADLQQLEGLCEVASEDEALPLDAENLSDQRIPTRLIQYGRILDQALEKADSNVVHVPRWAVRAENDWTTFGRWVAFGSSTGAPWGWAGIDLVSWRQRGRGPLWVKLVLDGWPELTRYGHEVARWGTALGHLVDESDPGSIVISVDLPTALEESRVVESVARQLEELAEIVLRHPGPASSQPPVGATETA